MKALEAIENERNELRRYKIELEAEIKEDHPSCSVPSGKFALFASTRDVQSYCPSRPLQ